MLSCVCLSIGCHPVSQRPRMAPADRAALELALRCSKQVVGIFAGPYHEEVIQDYLGMGLEHVLVIDAEDQNPLEEVVFVLKETKPNLVFTGARAERAMSSGLFPYALSESLGLPVASDVCDVSLNNGLLELLQVAPGGRRRKLTGAVPAVISVAESAIHPRFSTRQRRQQGKVSFVEPVGSTPALLPEARPARQRGSRIRPGKAKHSSTQTYSELAPNDAARIILNALAEQQLLPERYDVSKVEGI